MTLACSLSLFNISLLILVFNWWFLHPICGCYVKEEILCFTRASLATRALLCINISIVFSLVFSTAHQILMIQNDIDGNGIGFNLNPIIHSILLLWLILIWRHLKLYIYGFIMVASNLWKLCQRRNPLLHTGIISNTSSLVHQHINSLLSSVLYSTPNSDDTKWYWWKWNRF